MHSSIYGGAGAVDLPRYGQSHEYAKDLPAQRIFHAGFFFFHRGMGEEGVPVTVEFGYVRG